MLKVNSNLMTAEAEEMSAIASQTEAISNAISNINSNLKWYISGSSVVRPKLQSYSSNLSTMSQNMSRLSMVLATSASVYEQTESELCENQVNQAIIESITSTGGYLNGDPETTSTSYSEIGDAIAAIIGLYSDEGSGLGKLKEISGYFEYLTDNEFFEYISDMAKEIKDTSILKIAGYLDDGKDFLEALSSGNTGTLEKLIDKYAKKGIGKLVTGVTLPEGVVGSTYINLAWNAGKNLAESATEFVENPSVVTAASAAWLTTAGAFFDTGTDLAKNGIELVYSVTGKEFDGDDFNEAMECLGSLVNPISYFTGENKEYVDAFTAVVSEAASNAATAVESAASVAADVISQGVISAGNYLLDGAVSIGNTVASWFGW